MSYRLLGRLHGLGDDAFVSYGAGSTISASVTNGSTLKLGDKWTLTVEGGPPNTAISLLTSHTAYPPPMQQVGSTDGNGNASITFTADGQQEQSQDGEQNYVFYMVLPNQAGSPSNYDPFAPPGFHNESVANVGFYVAGAGTPAPAVTPAPSVGPTYSPPAYSPVLSPPYSSPAIDPVLASALSAPSGILTSPAQTSSASSPGTQTAAAVSSSPAVSNNTLLIGGLAVVGILIMMSTGGKS
jgi:hypothetical protein